MSNGVHFGSRKFIVTMSVAAATIALAAFSKVDANVAMVLVACVAAYNWANAKTKTNGSG